ncbi:MAG TPA: iron ABC transporter permease [Fibrobacteraceae bacterium]|nr:iron ABC transporter permease [Fibrobacteraceae bacterium]
MNEIAAYHLLRKRQGLLALGLLLALLVLLLVSLDLGKVPLRWSDIPDTSSPSFHVLWDMRLPRLLAAIVGGAVLGVSGLILQNVLGNPMASPYTLGISGAAAFGAATAILFFPHHGHGVVQGASFLASALCIALVLAIAHWKSMSPSTLILAGIMLNALFTAATHALQYFSDDQKAAEILFWSFGDLNRARLQDSLLLLGTFLVAFLWLARQRWNFSLMSLGDEQAQAAGLSPARFRVLCLLVTAFFTSWVVSLVGTIAFAGLVVPHLARLLIRDDGPWLLPATTLMGGLFLLVCVDISQSLFQPVILPVGIVTAFCGAPFFLALLLTRPRN